VTYTGAALCGALGALVVDLFVLRTRLLAGATFWLTYPIVLVFQLLSNGILTGLRVVRYDPDAILGVRIVYAPVEDLAFGFALVLLSLSVWARLNQPPARPDAEPESALNRRGGSPPPPAA
jgi:lycopene cyclase domain-containing protein